MRYTSKTKGTCSSSVSFELEDGIVKNISFLGGCNGNTSGISSLCEGMPAKEVVARLKGIRCGFKSTSCPDQLACAIENALEKETV